MDLHAEILNIAMTILTACVGIATKYVVGFLNKKGIIAQLENNKQLVQIVVHAVEQTYDHLKGDEKLNVAKIELVKLMNEKKITISEKEIDILIECSVREMNNAIKNELKNNESNS